MTIDASPLTPTRASRTFGLALAAFSLLGSLVMLPEAAQAQVAGQAQYKYIAADGTLTYSDRPPPPDAQRVIWSGNTPTARKPATLSAEDAALPFEMRQAAQKYPVVLYTGTDCQPCIQGKQHLISRNIPYTEKTVRTQADLDALKKTGFSQLPGLSVGSQKVTGFESESWDQLLLAANYPKHIKLPPGYSAKIEPLANETPTVVVKNESAPADSTKAENNGKENVRSNQRQRRDPATIGTPAPAKPEPSIRF